MTETVNAAACSTLGSLCYTIVYISKSTGQVVLPDQVVGGGGGSAPSSDCLPTTGGGPYPTDPGGFGEVMTVTNDGTGCASSQNIVSDGGTMLFQNSANIEMTAASPNATTELSLIQPNRWYMQSSTGTPPSTHGPNLQLQIDDSNAAEGGGAGGGIPFQLQMAAVKDEPTGGWLGIDIQPSIGGSDKTSHDMTNIFVESLSRHGSKFRNYYGAYIAMNGNDSLNEEYGVVVESALMDSHYCDVIAREPNGTLRFKLGCGTTHASTFAAPVAVTELDVNGSGAGVMQAQEGASCPTPVSGYDILCALGASTHAMQLSNNGAAYITIGAGGGGGTPGGSSGQIQYNNAGSFGGFTASGDATVNTGTGAVTVAKVNGITISGTPAVGYVPTATSTSAATWQAPAGGSAFSAITGSTNTTAAMVLGAGSSLTVSGSGTNNATAIGGITVTGTPSVGYIPVATSGSAATWQSNSGGSAFSALTSATNTTAAMLVGTGASMDVAGSGTINATKIGGITVTGTPSTGQVPTATGTTAATWQTPSGGSGAMTLITDTLLASPAATVTFSSISGSYKTLKIFVQGACSAATTNDAINMQANGDTGSNYDRQATYSVATGSASGLQTLAGAGVAFSVPCTTAPADEPGTYEITIPNYSSAVFRKMANVVGGWYQTTLAAGLSQQSDVWHWRNTSAITQLVFSIAGGSNFITGTRFTLYGIN